MHLRTRAEGVALHLLVCKGEAAGAVFKDQPEIEKVLAAAVIVARVDRLAGHLHNDLVFKPLLHKAQILLGVVIGHVVPQRRPVHVLLLGDLPALAVKDMDDSVILDQRAGRPPGIRRAGVRAVLLRLIHLSNLKAHRVGLDAAGINQVALQSAGIDLRPVRHPGAAAHVALAHHRHVQAAELPLVVALNADRHIREPLDPLQRDHKLHGPSLPETVPIGEILRIARPFAVKLPHIVPDPVLGALQLLVLQADIMELEHNVVGGSGVWDVVRGDRDEVTLYPVHGAEGHSAVIALQRQERIRVRRHLNAVHGGGSGIEDRIVLSGQKTVAQERTLQRRLHRHVLIDGKADVADAVAIALCRPAAAGDAGRRGNEPRLRAGPLLPQRDAHALNMVIVREHSGHSDAVALLSVLRERQVPHGVRPHRLHRLAQGVDNQRQRNLPDAAELIRVAHGQRGAFAQFQVGQL